MAGGQWRLPIPPEFGNAAAALVAGQQVPIFAGAPGGSSPGFALNAGLLGSFPNPQNLLQNDGPTLLTEWDLESIYVPAMAAFAPAPAANANIVLTLQMLLNGTLVWQQQQPGIITAAFPSLVNLTFSDDFVNPITVKRCDVLKLAAQIVSDQATTFATVFAGVQATTASAISPAPGQIGYAVQEIPGRRRL